MMIHTREKVRAGLIDPIMIVNRNDEYSRCVANDSLVANVLQLLNLISHAHNQTS